MDNEMRRMEAVTVLMVSIQESAESIRLQHYMMCCDCDDYACAHETQ